MLAGRVPTGFVPDEDQGWGLIVVQLPDGASMQRTKAVYSKLDAILSKEKGLDYYTGIAGFNFLTRTASSYNGTGFVSFKSWEERKGKDMTAVRDSRPSQRTIFRHRRGACVCSRSAGDPWHQRGRRL